MQPFLTEKDAAARGGRLWNALGGGQEKAEQMETPEMDEPAAGGMEHAGHLLTALRGPAMHSINLDPNDPLGIGGFGGQLAAWNMMV